MTRKERGLLWGGMLIALSFVLAACATSPKRPLVLTPSFETLNIRRIVLLPVEFRDSALDRSYQQKAAEEIRWRAHRVLEKKGYEVVLDAAFPLPQTDAAILIRVDHFLEEGVYSTDGPQYLEIYATATMLASKDGTELWRDEGAGMANTSFVSPTTLNMELAVAPAYLADSLFATLPAAPLRQR